jgi:uncharacterized membrane protein YeiH
LSNPWARQHYASQYSQHAEIEMMTDALAFLQSVIQWTAILLAALAGAYEARRRDLDFFGTLVIAFVVSVGGGTLRDVLLARYPLFWVKDPVYAISVFCVTVVGVLVMTPREQASPTLTQLVKPVQRAMRSDHIPMWVIVIDALGLGLFAYLGTNFALQAGASPFVAPVFGVMTASFGGVIRDVFFAQTPSIFKRGQLYSTSAAIGSIIYVGLISIGTDATASFILCVAVTFLIRMASVWFDIRSL